MVPDDDNTRTYVALTAGTMVSHYRIIEKIGAGGMGEVYLAEDTKLDRKVALKFLPQHLCQNADCTARFTREAQATAKLSHPNIVTIFEVSDFNGRPFFAMEHVEGMTLKDVIDGKPLPMDRIIEIGIQVCEGLQAAHEKGITHRDIKPSNILIDSHGRARIVDFGLASVLGTDQLTKTGSTLGTIGYMSPEQVRGDKVDHRTDLFSFGVVLYEMITGHSPFKADSEAATLHAITNTKPDLLARFRREVPAEIQTIIDKALEKDVATRYQHADEIATDLKRLTSQLTMQVKPRRDSWNRYLVTAAAVVLLLVVGYWLVTKYSSPKTASVEPLRKVLAVLPFKNMSPDPDQEYFSDGMTEELTSKLSMVQSLCVISRSSSMTFKGSNKTIPEIARTLGAQFIVEGSVRRAGKELRITAQLIDASKDSHLWADSYTGTVNDVFDMQDSVTRSIVDGVRIQLTPNETRRLTKRSYNNLSAYEYWLKSRSMLYSGTEDGIKQGIAFLDRGYDIVGDSAMIFSGIAWGYWQLVNAGFGQDEYVSKAVEYAQRSVDIDPERAEAHAMLGWVNSAFLGNQHEAVRQFREALAIDSNCQSALNGLAVIYYEYLGKLSAARPIEQRLAILSPLDTITTMATDVSLQFFDGDYLPAIGPWRRQIKTGPFDPVSAFFLAMALAYCDSTSEAISIIDELVKANPTSAISSLAQMMNCALHDDRENALVALTPGVRLTCRRDAAWSYELGAILARAGAREEAYDWLENAVNRGNINYPFMQKDPFLNSLRGEDRFKKLMERVKYEWEHFDI
jgi:serine/threonine protein kinase/tetratricopeptide (TPR) repeat protein